MGKIVGVGLAFVAAVVLLIGGAVVTTVQVLLSSTSSPASPSAVGDIPANYLALYQQAATTCPGLDWSILAAIGKVETNHGRSTLPGVRSGSNSAGAQGPLQFLPATFEAYDEPIPPGGSNPPSPFNPVNAIHAAARYLCASGARDGNDLDAAIFAYNRADWYVHMVLDQAQDYRAVPSLEPPSDGWTVPVSGQCSSGFGSRNGGFHEGQDIAAPIGTPIEAASAGVVIDAGPASGYGLWVRIRHPDGTITTYGHHHRNLVAVSENVRAGQPIAEVGNRGESSGPHLHFQITIRDQPVDPVDFYQQRSASPLCG